MSDATVERFADRLRDYVLDRGLAEFFVTFHGGEPLLAGAERLAGFCEVIRDRMPSRCRIEFSIQTNGTLLTEKVLDCLEQAGVLISLSLDGPKLVNDLHRLDHGSKSSFDDVNSALERLRKRDIFRGVIAVIDALVPPRQLFEFFAPFNLPRLDLLLPDSTHVRPPPERDSKPDLYRDWLNEAYRLWFEEYPNVPLRWFDAILASRLGVPSPTDAMGMGSVSLIVIDTDGTYTDHDVFKIVANGRPSLKHSVYDVSLSEIALAEAINAHARRLNLDGLAVECRTCPVVEACGGGSVMHRWHPVRGLDAPSVYCRELFGVIETATRLLRESLTGPSGAMEFGLTGKRLAATCRRWREESECRADAICERAGVSRNGASIASVFLAAKSGTDFDFEAGNAIETWLGAIQIQSAERWLVHPFLDSIRVCPANSPQVRHGLVLLQQCEALLSEVDELLPSAMAALISNIVFVESTLESEDQIFSFSDDSAPNALYISSFVGKQPLNADDFCDSLYHEFLHHVLYNVERLIPLLHDHVFPRFPAPWRAGLRPSGSFFHGTFVFANLSLYWRALARGGGAKAMENAAEFQARARYGIASLRQFALLTEAGKVLLQDLEERLHFATGFSLSAPGAVV